MFKAIAIVAGASCHRKTRRLEATATKKYITAVVSILTMLLLYSSGQSAVAMTGTENSVSKHGISAVIIPAEAQPGDIVELRVEMSREIWGRFNFQIPKHRQLRQIAEEKIPVSYDGGHYQQRHSLLLQALSSGEIVIAGASAIVSTSDGDQTVDLPDLTLNVNAFKEVALSDAPLPLPPAERESPTSSSPTWIVILIGAVVVSLLALCGFFLLRERGSLPDQSIQNLPRTSDIVDQLRSDVMPKRALERFLNDPSTSISTELRSKIEQAVYSVQIKPADLARLLQEELQP